MKREALIAAGVLVPFAVLVAAGFWFTRDEKVVSPGQISLAPPKPVVFPTPGPGLDPVLPVDAGLAAAPAPAPRVAEAEPLSPPLAAVAPEVQRCFADQARHDLTQVRVRFTPTRDGGFVGVAVDTQDPYLAACIEDVFAEVAWHPTGAETFAPATHSFSYDASAD